MARPTDAEVTAAARVLFEKGVEHGWWPNGLPQRLEELDPIGREEFEALVEDVLVAARVARPRPRLNWGFGRTPRSGSHENVIVGEIDLAGGKGKPKLGLGHVRGVFDEPAATKKKRRV